jgi:raffinose/stachyose/melibiose transport system permease protein
VAIGFLVFSLYPNVWVIALSFFKYAGFGQPQFMGLRNFIRTFSPLEMVWKTAIRNTFIFVFGKLAMELPLAMALAVMLSGKVRGKTMFRAVYFLPNVTSPAVMALVFYFLFASYNGIINAYLVKLGVVVEPIQWLSQGGTAMFVCMLVSVWQNFGINMVLFLSAIQAIPQDVYESGEIDGAVGVKKFFYITMPLMGRMLQVILMLALIGSLRTFDIVNVLTNGGPGSSTEVMMTYIYRYFFGSGGSKPAFGYASALGLQASVIVAAITAIYLFVSRKLDDVY